jgi:diguanylate cyclase (GGDEF)-like protein
MISLKKYLDTAAEPGPELHCEQDETEVLPVGNSSLDACPALGNDLKKGLGKLEESLADSLSCQRIEAVEKSVQEQLQDWGRRTARHYQEKTGEVKEMLLVMARTAESVGARDERCALQINQVTTQLKTIANLEDLSEIRASIEQSASELKTSIDRMTAEGKAAIDQLRAEVTGFQTKLDEAERVASCDSLTGVRSRLCVEGQMERRVDAGAAFCVAILDINRFKRVNDEHGHLAGDELLRQFATELKSACRSTDIVGRWGGDEFIILLDSELAEAKAQTDRLIAWVCGNYTVQGGSGPVKLSMDASIGLAESKRGETLKELLARADAEMYRHKAASSANGNRKKQ